MKTQPMPREGGSYVRQPDGSLLRQHELRGDSSGETLPEIDATQEHSRERVAKAARQSKPR